jgi:hypothetical protein
MTDIDRIESIPNEEWKKLADQFNVDAGLFKQKVLERINTSQGGETEIDSCKAAPLEADEENCFDMDEEIPLPGPLGIVGAFAIKAKICVDSVGDKWRGDGQVCFNPIVGDASCGKLEISDKKVEGEISLDGSLAGHINLRIGFNPQSQCIYTRGEAVAPLETFKISLDRDNLICF